MTTAHTYKVTKEQARIYKSCCGHTAQFYTSKQFGLSDSYGWYITNADGSSELNRFATLKECKVRMANMHTVNLLDFITDAEKAGA